MSMMIVPIPHFDSNLEVQAYWLESHDGKKMLGVKDNFHRLDSAFVHFGLDLVERIGIEPFTGGKRLFIPLSRMQLISGLMERTKFDREQLVCVVPSECVSDPTAAPCIQTLRESGCQVGLEDFPLQSDAPAMEHVGFIALDYTHPQFRAWYDQVSRMKGKRAIICNVPDMETFNALKNDSNAYFTGGFYTRPITARKKAVLSPLKVNALRLINNINQEDFDFEDIIRTIERDPYLSVSLLRFLNSTASGLSRQVESIRQAVTILGQNAVRQWATIALSTSLGMDRPNEITKLALVRAKFAEDIAGAFDLGVFQSSLFMMGLFSLLDIMLEKPMEEALEEVAVSRIVKTALLGKSGALAPVMELICAYERADWDRVSILMIQNHIDMEHIGQAYTNALVWYRNLLQSIDDTNAQAAAT